MEDQRPYFLLHWWKWLGIIFIIFLIVGTGVFLWVKANENYPNKENTTFEKKEEVINQVTPLVVSVNPKNSQKDVILTMEDPVMVEFDRSTFGYWVDFELNPAVEVVYENNESKTQFRLLPKASLSPKRSYQLSIFIRRLDAPKESRKIIYSGSFETAALDFNVSPIKGFENKLADSKSNTQPKILSGKYIDVNLKDQTMNIFENGNNLGTFLISSGKPGMGTPPGQYQVYNKKPRAWSKMASLWMPFWMAIRSDGRFGIHELPEWPNGFKEGEAHLGTPVSHGCIRLGVGAAQMVYNWADIGTPIVVY